MDRARPVLNRLAKRGTVNAKRVIAVMREVGNLADGKESAFDPQWENSSIHRTDCPCHPRNRR